MEFYYVLSKDKRTATCYYDYRREERGGILPWGNSHYVFGLFRRLFGLRYSLKKVVFDATCKSASFASTTEWFSGCSSLEEITGLENLNTSKVKDMHAMFCGCHVLSALDLSSFDTTQVTNMSLMFCGCRALSALDLSSFDTTQVTNMSSMFRGCSALTALDLSSFNTTSVGGMMSMFQGCKSLKALDLSSSMVVLW